MPAAITGLVSSAHDGTADDQAVQSSVTSAEGRDANQRPHDNLCYMFLFMSHGSEFVTDRSAWNCRYTPAVHPGAHLAPTFASNLVTDIQTRAYILPLLPNSHVRTSRLVTLQQSSTSSAPLNRHRLTTCAVH